jgi:hypothetical protein
MSDRLTREELHAECRKIIDALPDRGEMMDGIDDAILKLNKQAAQAIDLQAENERLKAALDSITVDVAGGINPCKSCKFIRWYRNTQEENEQLKAFNRNWQNSSQMLREEYCELAAELAAVKGKLDAVRQWVDFWGIELNEMSKTGHGTILSILGEVQP